MISTNLGSIIREQYPTMIKKDLEKERAVRLRKQGKTYSEILNEVKVAKSTLSLWLREIGLAEKQKQTITRKRVQAQKKGAESRRIQRKKVTREIIEKASDEIRKISKRELLLIGIALYWAEGSKQKTWNASQAVQFTNSDAKMVRIYLKWLREILGIKNHDISCWIALHESSSHRMEEIKKYWRGITGLNKEISDKVYLKHHRPKSNRRNVDAGYFGSLKIAIKKSTNLNRRIEGWVNGVCKSCRIV